jgi:subtilisin family serine protease/PKD repeat protein
MKLRLLSFLTLFIFMGSFSYSQTLYEFYQDGLVVFQLKQNAKIIPSDERIVKFEHHELFSKHLSGFEIEEVLRLHPDIKDAKLKRTYQIRLSNINNVDNVVSALKAHSSVLYAELKELHYPTLTPNDPAFSQANQWSLFQIQAEQAWDVSTGDANVVVAVTDNAINVDHPDLTNKMVGGWDAVDSDNDPRGCGSNTGFHGSHVSGIVGAETDNSTGIASIGFDISIMPVKIGDCSGALTAGYDGIIWAADNNADVINMSWGGGGSSNYGQNTCDYAWNAGSILIAAAGNNNQSTQFYPAAYNNVVSVASTNQNDQKSSFSQYGTWIDISAPGSSIYSTNDGSGYQTTQGTSMASPLVAGLVGLMKSTALSATNTDIINCLYSGADNIDGQNSGYIGQLGAGRINALNSMNCASNFSAQNDAAIVEIINPQSNLCAASFTPEIVLRNYGSNTLTSTTITYDWNGSPQTFNWTGNLPSAQTEVITLPSQTGANGSYTFEASTSVPNGVADQNPGNDQSTENFTINANGQIVDLEIITDCFGSEITWEITDDNNNNAVVQSGGGYADVTGGETNNQSFCLGQGCYTFTIFDSYEDGMYGSQWGSCSVDGDYQMTDANGGVLFEMTATNSDFGASASHQFCITQPNNINDAGIQSITSPAGIICASTFQPEVILRNYGNDPLTSVTINYQTTGGLQTYAWTGNLSPQQTELVTLPAMPTGSGAITLTVYTTNPNGLTDDTPTNDENQSNFTAASNALALPFTEDFETNVFNSAWSLQNPDNETTWELFTVGGITPGSQAAKIDFYNYQQSARRDGLISPKISFAGYTSVDLTFDHAYRRFDQTAADSLIIYVSTDCGSTWTREFAQAEDGTGSFATQTTNTADFTPSIPDDWCFSGGVGATCFTVNLDSYVGQDVFVMFESYNAGTIGNNLYIDNINIDGVPAQIPPTPNFTADNKTICEGGTVSFTDQSTSNITDWNWSFPGGSPATSIAQNPTVTYANAGTYDVILEVTNAFGTETTTFTNEITVNTPPVVSATAANNIICEGQSVQLTASGANSYTWDNNLGSGSVKTVSPQVTTVYEVVGSNGAGCADTETITITVEAAPTVVATANQTSICAGQSVNISASGADTYTWDNGLGAGAFHTVSPSTSTVYNVTGETTAAGCTNTANVAITVEQQPVVSVSASQTTICEGETTTLSANGANTYAWTPGTGLNSSIGGTIGASPTTTTTYTVEGTNSCGVDTETITINVVASPSQPVISQSGNVLSVTLQTGETAEWFFNGNSVGTGSSITMTQSGQYTVVVSNENNCDSQNSGNFEVDTTGLSDLSIDEALNLYPNPTDGMLYITFKGYSGKMSISVIDAIGRVVISDRNVDTSLKSTLDMSSFETGVYTVIFRSGQEMITKKVTLK